MRANRPFTFLGLLFILAIAVDPAHAQEPDPVTTAQQIRDAGRYRAAIAMLRQHLTAYPDDTRARLVMAEAYYWDGDYARAAKHFRDLVQADSTNASARRQLAEIEAMATPHLNAGGFYTEDTQPIDRTNIHAEAGFFINPLWSVRVRADAMRARSRGVTLDDLTALMILRGYLPGPRVSFEASGGAAPWRSSRALGEQTGVTLLGSARLGRQIASGLTATVSVTRSQYTSTIASMREPLAVVTPAFTLRLDRNGWIGEAAGDQQLYPDDNSITTMYAWLLAPLVRRTGVLLQVGAASSYQDALKSRRLANNLYDPYFTPEQEMQAGAAASFAAWTRSGLRFQVNGSHALYGRKGDAGTREDFSPYNAHAALTIPFGRRASLLLDAERSSTTFYQQTRAGASISYKFAPRPVS